MTKRENLVELLEGVKEFQDNIYPGQAELFKSLASSQQPPTLFITCSDSRINPSLITQSEPGQLFIIRNVGNIIPAYGNMVGAVASAIEYAVGCLHVRNIIICGHSNCGAMEALTHAEDLKLPTIKQWMRNAEAALSATEAMVCRDGCDHARCLTENNVRLQMRHLKTHPVVAAAIANDTVNIEGWYYDIPNGKITVITDDRDQVVSVEEMIERLHKDPKAAK